MTETTYVLNPVEHNGKRVTIRSLPGDMMAGKYRANQYYEKDLLLAIARRQAHGVYVDVGANIGNHTIFFAQHCPSTHVISIEPRKDVYDALCLNVAGIPEAGKITTMCYAAGAADGTGTMTQNHPDNAGSSAVVVGESGAGDVLIRPLDSLVSASPVAVLKIDVEGYEGQVLAGATRILQEHPLIAAECQTDQLFKDMCARLVPLGYRCCGKYCATPTYLFDYPEHAG